LRFQKDETLSQEPQETRRVLGLLQQDHELRMILHKDMREGELDLDDLPEQAREREDAEGMGEGREGRSVGGGMEEEGRELTILR
jgi:hypothetical protein